MDRFGKRFWIAIAAVVTSTVTLSMTVAAHCADNNTQSIVETKARLESLDKNFSEFQREIKPKLDVMVTKADLDKRTTELKDLINSKKRPL
ncbi:MAG TPA: hypothetical protein VM577_12785 [Anaerovoracaceae bacterium]|nr:hypothetical protein [Anaerovoracaceae bacterium]